MDDFIRMAIDAGAFKAYIIDCDRIPFDKGLRDYCAANYCGNYGCNYACPPHVGTADELIAKAKAYQKALIFQTVHELEDSYDFEGMRQAAQLHDECAEKISWRISEIKKASLRLTAGGCHVCDQCAILEQKPCNFPHKAVSSLEAYCMNVSTLASLCEMNYINGKDTVTYFGAFLFNDV